MNTPRSNTAPTTPAADPDPRRQRPSARARDRAASLSAVDGFEVARNGALSARERQVLARVARSTPSRVIAAQLFITEATVETHLTQIYQKLGVTNRAAVARAYQLGILG